MRYVVAICRYSSNLFQGKIKMYDIVRDTLQDTELFFLTIPFKSILLGIVYILGLLASLWVMEEKLFIRRRLYWYRGLRRLAKVIALLPVGIVVVVLVVMLAINLADKITFLPNSNFLILLTWVAVAAIIYHTLKYIMTGLTWSGEKINRHKKRRNKEFKRQEDKERKGN